MQYLFYDQAGSFDLTLVNSFLCLAFNCQQKKGSDLVKSTEGVQEYK